MININPLVSFQGSFSTEKIEKFSQTDKTNKSDLTGKQKERLKQAAEAFESMMVYQMFKSLKKNVDTSGLVKNNQAQKIFDDFLTKEHSQQMSGSMSLGIAKSIYEQNIKYLK